MSFRFLHTGDWQRRITRQFFSEGVHERFAQSRFDAIRKWGCFAKEKDRGKNLPGSPRGEERINDRRSTLDEKMQGQKVETASSRLREVNNA